MEGECQATVANVEEALLKLAVINRKGCAFIETKIPEKLHMFSSQSHEMIVIR